MAQRGQLFCWVPVALAIGIGSYFSLTWEPPVAFCAVVAVMACLLMLLAMLRADYGMAPFLWAVALILAGFSIAALRAHMVGDTVLGWRYYGAIEGRVVAIDRSSSDALRLTLDRVRLSNTTPERTPGRVRVALHGTQGFVTPVPGMRVMMSGHLSPPSGPVEPGGFDFQRHAWFQGLGAVGYTRTPVLMQAPAGTGQWVFKARMWLSQRVQTRLDGETGGFAAAIMTGDRSAISQDTLKALRVSNLAHLLAISGLHMGLLAGFVFAALRLCFAALPRWGLRWPAKKLAALGALIMAALYLALSGGNVATERAFIMVAVMLCAILADRRALSIRAVAMAAVLVLILQPEALLGPGFQMSFAATTALVAAFGAIRDHELSFGPVWFRPVQAVVLSSFIAGLATAPIAAAHFNQIAHFSLLANLLSVPLMGILVIPSAVVAACLLPLGLDWVPLWVMGLGLDWILGVAHFVSGLDGARGTVVSPGGHVLPLISLGMLFLILWRGPFRMAGGLPVLLAFWFWSGTQRPDVLIADTGNLIGVMTEQGRALNRAKGSGFIATNWLENDGDAVEQEGAYARWMGENPSGPPDDWPILIVRGKVAAEAFSECQGALWVVMNVTPLQALDPALPCKVLTPQSLRVSGAVALYRDGDRITEITARQMTGARLWSKP